ncbi:nitroreductase family protein [Sedimentibacter hydroxybenzoicus DSM 7310]|uniref:Nitroreductase family protein n=1 Tax=Sedimentibacter hydroxybenzoicus DSM 7310 TaxID=1123245 RepID=A0A974BIA0_SEDHY|nr:nitroreductase family protein [Sedimentibacter hydroxybenzoicus]NYB73307.1 nitroreductase family protein [Sedimentibacter hydroxybenzoicus DSM 7310]
MEYKDIISRIKSVRNYKEDTVSPEILEQLKADFEKGKRLIDDIQLEVMLKNKDEVYGNLKNIAGYNDLMIEAPHYLIFLSEDKGHYIENTGYAVQNIMLKAFESGVGSCWITIKDGEAIKEKLNINSDKKLSAIIALGYDDNKNKVLYENVSEYNPSRAEVEIVEDNVSERMRVRDLVYLGKWGEDADPDELARVGLLDAFFYARLAPSTKNRQPWRFIYDNGTVVLTLRKDENVNEYEQKVDTGIVMLYFKLIVDSTLFNLEWKFGNPDKDYEISSDYEIVAYCIS